MARIAFNESIGTDRGEAIVGAMVTHLRQNYILLPSAAVLEKIALMERARARKRAYKELTAGMDHAVREKLDALICVADDGTRTRLAWLREWPEAPVQKISPGSFNGFSRSARSASSRTGNQPAPTSTAGSPQHI
jgi:hypothetical protein